MSKLKPIKTFRDLLSFLTIIPVGGKEDFVLTSAEHLYLFPLIGGFIGLLGAAYFLVSSFVISNLMSVVGLFVQVPTNFVLQFAPAAMTIAFLLVLTGMQHFDGLVDLGNAIGVRSVHERKMVAHAWTVTYSGAFLALIVELIVFAGLFFLDPVFAFGGIIAAEVAAKLAMVTIVWIGKPTHKGLGSIFLMKAKKKLNAIAYLISALIVYPFLGFIGVAVVLASIPVAFLMEKVGERVFGGVSGDMIGATNEVARATTLIMLVALVILL
ncbi:MAG TPA: adenosylcobinamide-GDP ribazoletransferase [Candidatus Bathyarchaeia archaeon]